MPNIRILICKDCQSTETLPDFQGRPDDDVELEYALQKHEYPDRSRHLKGKLFIVDEGVWSHPEAKEKILQKMWQDMGHTGLEPWVYQAVDTLRADAMKCWRGRGRPERCADFHSDKKILTPPTQSERREAGMKKYDKSNPAAQRFLCDYCPMRSVAEQEMRAKQGLYD
jgi:hypothetical protein